MTTTRSRLTPSGHRPLAPALAALASAGALTLAAPLAAEAHVSVATDTTAAGAHALVTLSVPHGCEGSATTAVAVRLPEGVHAATPTVNPGWTVTKRVEKLTQPITDQHGERLTSRVAEVVWTARVPLPDGYRDALSLQVAIPEDAVGQQLVFPAIQTCERGRTAWTQTPAAGQDAHDLEHPAPSITVTAAEEEGDHHQAAAAAAAPEVSIGTAAVPAVTTTASAGSGPVGVAGLVLGALGLVAGLGALLRTRTAPGRAGRS